MKNPLPVYLTINSKGTVRATKTPPSTEWDEVTIQLDVTLPEGIFTRPTFRASVALPAAPPPVIPAEVIDRLEGVLERETGIRVELTLVDPSAGEGEG